MSTIDATIIKALVDHIGGDSSNIPEGTIGHNLTAEMPILIENNKLYLLYNTTQFELNNMGLLSMKPSANGLYTYFSDWGEPVLIENSKAYGGYYINKAVNMKIGDMIRLQCKDDWKLHTFFIAQSDNSAYDFKAICSEECTADGYMGYFYIKKATNEHWEIYASDFKNLFNGHLK